MAVNWDWLLGFGIIVGLILTFAAKITGQTIGQLLTDMREFIMDTKDEAIEKGEEIAYYE